MRDTTVCEIYQHFAKLSNLNGAERESYLQGLEDGKHGEVLFLRQLLEDCSQEVQQGVFPDILSGAFDELGPACVGKYHVLELLGRGGMGHVYLVEDRGEGYVKRFALKLFDPKWAQIARDRLLQERALLARLNHSSIANMVDAGTTPEGVLYLVMEYVDGLEFLDYCQKPRMPTTEKLTLFLELCAAVAHAHHHFVIHLDIKPSNILVTKEARVKLLDFGIAQLVEPSTNLGETPSKTRYLTPSYASPELLRGERVTVTSDVFSLGVLLWELVSGDRPYATPSIDPHNAMPTNWVKPVLSTQSREVGQTWSRDLEAVMRKAIAPEEKDRYGTVEAFMGDVSAYLGRRPVQAIRQSKGYLFKKFLSRNRLFALLATVIFLAIGAGFVSTIHQANRAKTEAKRAQVEADRALAVRDFLVGLFEAEAPGTLRDELPTTAELLEHGANTAQAAFKDYPIVRAEMLTTLGSIFVSYWRQEEAEILLNEAEHILKAMPDPDALLLGRTLYQQGLLLANNDKRIDSERVFRESLALLEPAQPRHLELRIRVGDGLLDVLRKGEKFESAMPLARQFVTEVAQYASSDDYLTAKSGHMLAYALWDGNNPAYKDEISDLLPIVWQRAQDLNDRPILQISILTTWGIYSNYWGEVEKSLKLLTQALVLTRKVYPKDHPEIAIALNRLATPLKTLGHYEQCVTVLKEALTMFTKSVDGDHGIRFQLRYQLGNLLVELERPSEAEPYLRKALEQIGVPRPKDPSIVWPVLAYARVLVLLEQFKRAQPLLNEALAITVAQGSKEDEAHCKRLYALFYLRKGSAKEAREASVSAIEIYNDLYPKGLSYTIQSYGFLGASLAALDNIKEAESAFSNGRHMLSSLGENAGGSSWKFLVAYAEFLISQGRHREAYKQLQFAHERLTHHNTPDHPLAKKISQRMAVISQ